MIHPTAQVDPGARLGANVSVGAYAVIGPDVHELQHDELAVGLALVLGHGEGHVAIQRWAVIP